MQIKSIKATLKGCKRTLGNKKGKLKNMQYLKSTHHIKSENIHVKNMSHNVVLIESDKTTSIYNVSTRVLSKK